uniref:Rho guanine nucleotide exchange factor 11 n=1 Tax=Arion vulgaris TaxID=1028688 RepID=A0A0B7BJT6_9EUPU
MPLSDRLSSIGSRDQSAVAGNRDMEQTDSSGSIGGLMQKCIIIQRDDKGYGFTVSGDNPVFVASVKQDGAAAKAGVQNGDRIIKVNGALVTQRNHLDVVKLIKSGYYVALTLLSKPSPNTSSNLLTNTGIISSNRDSVLGRVTVPQPVNPDKDKELWQQKVHMTNTMYETAKEDFEKLQKLYVSRPSEKLHTQLLEKERIVKALDNKLKQLTGGQDTHSSMASNLPAANISDLGSMSDSPQTSPSVSPTPTDNSNRHNGQEMEDFLVGPAEIIHIDDEEINSEDDQVNDPGPFANINLLDSRPAHMAVLLNYLISNSDPSPVLFHIISDLYSRSPGSNKELRKWAYEMFSTFIYKLAPLSISVEDNIISQIDSILTNSGGRTDNENVLRTMFNASRQSVQMEIAELLVDFCSKKDLGMGSLYGSQKVNDNMDRILEVKVAEELLMPHLRYFGAEDNTRGVIVDKDLATGWALATFLRSLCGTKFTHIPILDRMQTFLMRDKKSIKFPGSRSSRAKAVKGHQLTLQHFYVITFCNLCDHLVWGVGCQGYQCQNCDMALHKSCADDIIEQCAGKQKKDKRIIAKLPLPGGASQPRRSSSSASGQHQPTLSVTEQVSNTASTGQQQTNEACSLPLTDTVTTTSTQPYPRLEDTELAGLHTGHSVKSIITRYQTLTSPTGTGPGTLGVPDQEARGGIMTTDSTKKDRRGSSDLNRSGSLNNKDEKGDRPTRRTNSDVRVDADTFKAINQSGSSSASSLSNWSAESAGNSTDNVSDLLRAQHEDPDLDVETELPSLKQVLPEEVLRKLKPKEKKRQEVINELFYTERAHLRNLKVLDLLFHRPMHQEKGIMMDLARALFPNMEEIISLHVSFVKDIKERSQAAPVVKDVGDLLLKRFDGGAGDKFRKGCAEYCMNQSFALDALKKQTRKDLKLQQFLHDAESNSLCRRLQLKDLVPSQMQRLTKYPLLIDNLLKYTQTTSEEYRRLERAHDRCKHILAHVNQAVNRCENYHKLKDIQKKLDRRSVEGLNDPALTDLKNIDLTQHKLIFDGPLTWKLRTHRMIDMHVLLFDDMLVLLQKQDDKYVLKCQNTNAQPARDDKYTHYPILKLQNLLARTLATEKRSFFVVNISESRAQMYEFTAASSELRLKWCKLINDKADELKKTSKLPHLSSDFSQVSQMERGPMDRNRQSRISRKGISSVVETEADRTSSPLEEDMYQVTDDIRHHLEISEECQPQLELIAPEEVSISDAVVIIQSTASSSSQPRDGAAVLSPGYTCGGRYHDEPNNVQFLHQTTTVDVPLPKEQIKNMSTQMNAILSQLAIAVSSGESDERLHLREELQKAQQGLDSLRLKQREITQPGTVCSERTDTCVATSYMSDGTGSPNTSSNTSYMEPVPAISSALSSFQQQEVDISSPTTYMVGDDTLMSSSAYVTETSVFDTEEKVHHGIQEDTMSQLEESVEPLSLSNHPTDLLPVVATEIEASDTLSNTSIQIRGHEHDVVNVTDLQQHHSDVINPLDVNDDKLSLEQHNTNNVDDIGATDTLTVKTNVPDFSNLTTTLEDIDGEEREVEEQADNICKTFPVPEEHDL